MLTRKKPITRKTPMKRTHWTPKGEAKAKRKAPLRKVSKSRARQNADYFLISKEYLKQFPACAICLVRGMHPGAATEIHHKFGRIGSLLCDVRGFISSCFQCRDFPHANPKLARELGILGSASNWNVAIDRHRIPEV